MEKLIIAVTCLLISYLVIVIVTWDLVWILDLPNWNKGEKLGLAFMTLCCIGIRFFAEER